MSRAALVSLAICLTCSFARADGIVLEAYTNERPPDATRLLLPIVEELTHVSKTIAGEQIRLTYETGVSKPAQTPEGLPTDFADQVDRGFRAWVGGKFDEAIKTLGPLLDTARANSGAFAKNQALREPMNKALIALALSEQRVGDPGAMKSAFAELLHSFPDAAVSRGTYGSEAFTAFDQVKREVVAAGEGKLNIKVAQDGGAVFVDEAYRGQGSTQLSLAPGDYRVLVMLNKQPSRTHYVTVRANTETTVTIDAELDQAIHTRGWTGFLFANDAARDAHEAQFAAAFANSIKAPSVAVISIEQVKGHAAIVGSLISLETGREIRRASVALDPDPSTDRLKALARFLAGENPAAGIDVLVGEGAPKGTVADHGGDHTSAPAGGNTEAPRDDGGEPSSGGGGRWGGWKYITAVGAAGGIVSGVYLAVEDGKCQTSPETGHPCNNVYSYSPYQWVALGAGAVLTAATVYLFATMSHEDSGRTAFVVPTQGGAIAGYSFRW
ncbi:MAG TPA: hypothetical protein VH143_11980 [Kofleriaceae bacterium]|nr:hypothetical protein [Kofleriaceae bacterium]